MPARKPIQAFASRALLALAAAFVGGCGGGDDDGGVTPPPTPTIAVAASPTTLSVVQGGGGTVTLTLTRGGGYAGAVALAVTGAPAGVTVTPNPASLTGATLTSTLTVAAAATAAPGTSTLTVRATGSGVADQTATVAFTVTAAPTPTVAIAAAPAALSIAAGGSGTTTLTLTRGGGFAGAVDLTAEGLPANVTAAFAPASVAAGGTTSTLTVTAAAAATAATTSVTLRARGTGVADATVVLPLTITPPVQVGGFTLALAPASLGVAQGAAGSTRLTIARTGGFAGAVTLTAAGAPAGVTITAPPSVAGDTATLAVAVASTAAPGAYTLTFTGAATGLPNQQATLALTVTPAAPTGGYTLAVTPATVSLAPGAGGTATVALTRTGGFADAVALAVTGAPAGLTITPSPASVTGASATLNLTSTTAVAPGTYPITVTGTAAGLANRTATFSVQVTQPPVGGTRVTYAFCAAELPIWVAYQSGTGAWTRATAGAGNSYAFDIASRGGVAYVQQEGTRYVLTVEYATAAELVVSGRDACTEVPAGTKRLTGSVAGVGLTAGAFVTMGSAFEMVIGGQTAFTLDSLPDGPLDLVASRVPFDLASGSLGAPDRLILRRGVNLPSGSTIPVLDFNSSEAFAPATARVTIANLGADSAAVGVSYFTGLFGLGSFSLGIGGSPQTYAGIPTDRLQAGDLHAMTVISTARGDTSSSRALFTFFRTVGDRTVTLGPPAAAPTITSLGNAPYPRLRAQIPLQGSYASLVDVDFSQTDRDVNVIATAGYFGGTAPATWDLSIPDLTAAGFDPAWALRPGVRTSWMTSVFGGDFLRLFSGRPTDGTTFTYASRSGTLAGSASTLRSRAATARAGTGLGDALARLGRARRAWPPLTR